MEKQKKKEELLHAAPKVHEGLLKPGGGDPTDLETIKRRNFVKKVTDSDSLIAYVIKVFAGHFRIS